MARSSFVRLAVASWTGYWVSFLVSGSARRADMRDGRDRVIALMFDMSVACLPLSFDQAVFIKPSTTGAAASYLSVRDE